MIQRIQSIWLLLAGLTLIAFIFTPLASSADGFHVMATGLYQDVTEKCTKLASSLPLLVFTIALALLSFVNIFNFKNRAMQKRFAYIHVFLLLGLLLLAFLNIKKIPNGLEHAHLGPGLALPVIAIIFTLMAVRGINNDEKLIRSADRLR